MLDASWASACFERFGLWGIFLFNVLEYACLPMPSEVLVPLAGFAAATAGVPAVLTVFVTVAAGLAGSLICYALGAYGGRPLLERLLRRFPAACGQLDKTEKWHKTTGGLSVMLARVIPLFRTWISFVSGICRQPLAFFLLYSAMGIIVWNSVLVLGGYWMAAGGKSLPGAVKYLPAAAWAGLLGVQAWGRRKRKK